MATGITTLSSFTPAQREQAEATFLTTPSAGLMWNVPAEEKIMKKKMGKIFRSSRMNKLNVDLTPLGEDGQIGETQKLVKAFVDTEVNKHGCVVEIEEDVLLYNLENVAHKAASALGLWSRDVEDLLTRDMLIKTATKLYCEHGNNGDNPTEIHSDDINQFVMELRRADARPMLNGVNAGKNFGTAPIPRAFFAMCHTDLYPDLADDDAWCNYTQYGVNGQAIEGIELGCLGEVRFFATTHGSIEREASEAGADIYHFPIVGQESFCNVKFGDYTAEIIFKDPIDPLNLTSTVSAKLITGQSILNERWVVNGCCTKSA